MRTVSADAVAVEPMLPDCFSFGIIVGISLEIVDQQEVGYRKAPYSAFADCPVGVEFVDAPVVGSAAPCDIFGRNIAGEILTALIYAVISEVADKRQIAMLRGDG